MSDAQRLMADVLAQHQGYCVTEEESVPPFLVRCDGNGECDGCSWDQLVCSYDDSAAAHRAHVAADVDKALGGLTRQWATGYGYPCPSAGDFVAVDTFRTRDEAKAQSDRVMSSAPGLVRREGWSWVSDWSEENP